VYSYNNNLLVDSYNTSLINFFYAFNNKIIKSDISNSFNYIKSIKLFFNNASLSLNYSKFFYIKPINFSTYISFYSTNKIDLLWDQSNYFSSSDVNTISNLNVIKKTNSYNLRANSSELISDYKSLQKVFKLRFDDFRSNSGNTYLSKSYKKHIDLIASPVKFDKVLLKNSQSFFSSNIFKLSYSTNNVTTKYLINSLNNYLFDVPFLVSLQSDQSRYI
jgi:hypothetical protein